MKQQLTCDQLLAYLSEYIDGNLNEALTFAAQEHLATCENCSIVLDSTQKTILFYKERGQVMKIPKSRKSTLYDQIARAFHNKEKPDS